MKVTINCISSWTTLDSFAALQAQQEVGAEIDTVFMASTKYIFIRFCLARHFFLLANNQIGGVGLAHPRRDVNPLVVAWHILSVELQLLTD